MQSTAQIQAVAKATKALHWLEVIFALLEHTHSCTKVHTNLGLQLAALT